MKLMHSQSEQAELEREVREARVETARRRSNWTEIPQTRLVRRGPFFVDAETDLLWVVRRGHVFEPGRSSVGYVPENTPMTFYIGHDTGEVVFLDPPSGAPRTWSEVVARRAAKARA